MSERKKAIPMDIEPTQIDNAEALSNVFGRWPLPTIA
jgi:hypothetical protein